MSSQSQTRLQLANSRSDQYQAAFADLNSQQRKAVEAIDGPVLVIAGPGTGKTQLLSMRVAHILQQSDAEAHNILCLTFTNKAAINMRQRLQRLIGPSANKVVVKTFHGFAAEIMNQHADYFWNGARLSTAPDAVQLEIIQSIIDQLPLSNPLSKRFANQYTGIPDIMQALQLSKEAGLTPDKLRAIIEANISYIDIIEPIIIESLDKPLSVKRIPDLTDTIKNLPGQGIDDLVAPLVSLTTVIQESFEAARDADADSGKTKHIGEWKRRWLQTEAGKKGMFKERQRNEWWLAFCNIYQKYRDQLHERGFYDYADMLLEVIAQLEQHPDLRATVQEQFQYVLIDEFQDSNAAQLRLSHLIADHYAAEGLPNIMAVGDDDQSIFGFNGAELNNLLFFERTYARVQTIVLTDNYRSSQAVLDFSGRIIDQASDRLVRRIGGLKKDLIAKNPPDQPGTIEHLSFENRAVQLSTIATTVKEWHNSKAPETVAILARSHDSLKTLASILLEQDVPLRYEYQNNILDHIIIQQIMTLAHTLVAIEAGDTQAASSNLAKLLQHPAWGVSANELWQLALANRQHGDWYAALNDSEHAAQRQLGAWLGWLARECTYQPLQVICEYMLGLRPGQHMTSPLREYFIGDHANSRDISSSPGATQKNKTSQLIRSQYLESLSAIRLLQNLTKEFAATEQTSLQDFIRFIQVSQDSGRGITDESIITGAKRAVELYTIHKAKGLEFDHVYLVDAIDDNWRPRHIGRKPPANLPLQPPGETDDDYVRLLYVATTRAKASITVTSYRYSDSGKELLATPYIDSILPGIDTPAPPNLRPEKIIEETLAWPRLEHDSEVSHLRPLLANYQLSATHLLNFLDVTQGGPQHFLERHLLRIPEPQSDAMAYGNAVHHALQLAQDMCNAGQFELERVTTVYQTELHKHQLPHDTYEKYAQYGKDVIEQFLSNSVFQLTPGTKAEQQLNDVIIGNAIAKGVLDALHIESTDGTTTALITDYKTGSPLSSFATKDRTKALKAWRHKSQLIFYCMLLRQSPQYENVQTITAQMVYVEAAGTDNKNLVRPYLPSSEDIVRMERLVQAVWKRIMATNFILEKEYSADIEGIRAFEDDLISGTI